MNEFLKALLNEIRSSNRAEYAIYRRLCNINGKEFLDPIAGFISTRDPGFLNGLDNSPNSDLLAKKIEEFSFLYLNQS